ncbi:hypothetical protein T484DRAFT_1830283 [Baffinella frigidus]|nr:hypothetical protein T484DRAFT_1830283 [Cryptophyta sp. CCMP2293]
MLADREGARRFRDYRKADDIRDALRMEMGIHVDDEARTWRTGADRAPTQGGARSFGGGGRGGGRPFLRWRWPWR